MDRETDRPDLPDRYSLPGFFIGLALAMAWFKVAEMFIPVDPLIARIAAAPVAVFIFLGVPAAFERVYWRWHDVA